MADELKIGDDDFDYAMKSLRRAWHEHEELSEIDEPSEDAIETIVAAIFAALYRDGHTVYRRKLEDVGL